MIKSKQHFIQAHKFLEQSLSAIPLNTYNSEWIMKTVYKNQGEEERQYGKRLWSHDEMQHTFLQHVL